MRRRGENKHVVVYNVKDRDKKLVISITKRYDAVLRMNKKSVETCCVGDCRCDLINPSMSCDNGWPSQKKTYALAFGV